MRRISLIVFSTLVLLVRCFPESEPATPGSIRGTVVTKTQNGEPAVLPDARIVLRGPVTRETQSDAQGAFAIDGLPPGMYEVEVSAPGLSATIAVEVKPGTTSVVPIELGMATVASTVSVAASEPPLIEESAQKNTIGGRIVQEAPNQNEKIESLLPLVPGVVRGPISTRLRLRVRLRPHHDIFLSQDGQLIGLSFADRYELVPAGFTTR